MLPFSAGGPAARSRGPPAPSRSTATARTHAASSCAPSCSILPTSIHDAFSTGSLVKGLNFRDLLQGLHRPLVQWQSLDCGLAATRRYCECFASGRYCEGCNCANCCNNRGHEATRQAAVEAILERNPNAFRPKIQANVGWRVLSIKESVCPLQCSKLMMCRVADGLSVPVSSELALSASQQ